MYTDILSDLLLKNNIFVNAQKIKAGLAILLLKFGGLSLKTMSLDCYGHEIRKFSSVIFNYAGKERFYRS